MARTVRNYKIDTRSARARLPAKPAIHWTVISPGCSVGYRKGRTGGVWIAKFVANGLRAQTTLGRADDIIDADGGLSLSYSEAQEHARVWFAETARQQTGNRISPKHYTVKDCVEDYVAEQRRRGSKSLTDTISRVQAHIIPGLGSIAVSKLTAQQIRAWHSDMAGAPKRLRSRRNAAPRYQDRTDDPEAARKRKATSNRTLTILKAALNHAFREGRAASDTEWRRVKPFQEVETARIKYLTEEECSRLTAAAEGEFRDLVRAALATGCRYSELASLRQADFDAATGTLRVQTSKSGRSRDVVLRPDGIRLFQALTQGKKSDDLILHHSNGKRWDRSHQIRPLAVAARKAQLSDPVTFHILRHTYASHLAMAGVPLRVIATNLGHADSRMTEKHYAHLAKSYVADELRKAVLGFSV